MAVSGHVDLYSRVVGGLNAPQGNVKNNQLVTWNNSPSACRLIVGWIYPRRIGCRRISGHLKG